MSKYEDSIKCKYCGHFESGVNRCHLYYNYDSSIDEGGGPYLKETSPDSRCSHFVLPGIWHLAQAVGKKRGDGTYIVDLSRDPQLKQQLETEERRGAGKFDGEKALSVIKWMFGGLIVGFTASFVLGAMFNAESFPAWITVVCTIAFACIGFFKE